MYCSNGVATEEAALTCNDRGVGLLFDYFHRFCLPAAFAVCFPGSSITCNDLPSGFQRAPHPG
jgi:hypothetical protein